MNSGGKYFNINNFEQAIAIAYITGQRYYKFDNETYGKVYSFENTEKFQQARKDLWELQKQYCEV
jgi:hypothetical protein